MKHSQFLRVSIAAMLAAFGTAACENAATDADGNAQVMSALPDLPATLPLETGETTPIAYAPGVSDLPDAPALGRARIANEDESYGYADAAYSYSEAIGDSPPDYGFDYDGSEPWAWQGSDDSLMFAEPIDDGYRQYYYRPGATEPYFIRDPYYAYGFASGMLAVIYAADGGIVSYADYGPRYAYASRYFARGRSLYGASRRGRRQPVIAANWFARSPILFSSRQRWGAGRARQPAWNAYYQANRPRQANYWREESIRRQADTRRIGAWRDDGFRSAAPARAIPAAWKNAKWARDDRRYRPAGDAGRDQPRGGDRPNVADNRPGDRADRADGADRGQARQREQAQAERQRERDRGDRPRDREQAQADTRPDRGQPTRGADRADGGRDEARPDRQRDRQQADRQQARPERPARAERAERIERPQRVERQDRPERPQRVERQERVERPERPERRQRDTGQADQQRQQAQRQQSDQREQAQRERGQREQGQREQGQRDQQQQQRQAQQQQAQQAQRQAQQQQVQQAQQQRRQGQQQQEQQARPQQRQQQPEQRQQRPRRDRDE